ncbi:vWA domain-containing protein [Sporosarcina ureilytica]|uniref:VWFA domain-containing protein n=1 Tax=Sporosarcina ureilytica TaxID=298596 RepID=A0A1D8JG75_9BACL|nr:hypothetical protein [Sporosarcina ureilytica]AOV07701.1 hypothetical protein BI350_09260 [Sporosarcina ureilytica]
MVKMNRFIQFNDETVDTKTLILYERLARALADANYLELTERKLLEFRPEEGVLSMTVFWRHRAEEIMHAGRLSDIYLLSAGFWKHFNIQTWRNFTLNYEHHTLKQLAFELLLMLEEFRLSDKIMNERPGTVDAFTVRKEAYVAFHRTGVQTNMRMGHLADALLNELYIVLYEGTFAGSSIEWGPIQFDLVKSILENAYDTKSTEENVYVVNRIMTVIEDSIQADLLHQYYSIGDAFTGKEIAPFEYHEGMQDAESGEEDSKDTIEEVFRTWHEENEEEQGVHLQFELEHGRSSKAIGEDATEGSNEAEIEETGYGQSVGDKSEQEAEDEREQTGGRDNPKKQAGHQFGKEHLNVVYEEQIVEIQNEIENRRKLQLWRESQKPYVRSFVEEMRKRIDLKQETKRERLMHGRLSTKLTTLLIDERPKPFYRKNAPSTQLDAVFGLLVDGSASMIDKLDETKKAVLLFHDVLRELQVSHEISSYAEDAFKASAEVQPNIFGLMHTFQDRNSDSGLPILSFDAGEDNRDGFAIRWMADRLARRPEKHKFLLVFSDGEPSAFGYDRNGIVDTAEAVMESEKRGISVIHLFLAKEEPTEDQRAIFSMIYGNKTASSHTVEGFSDQTLRILRKLLAIVIRTN